MIVYTLVIMQFKKFESQNPKKNVDKSFNDK